MKARAVIIALVLSVSIYAAATTDAAGDELKEGAFGQYYEPYEPNIEPNAPGYTLPLDLNDIANYDSVNREIPLDQVTNLIRQNGFAIMERSGLWPWDPLGDNIITFYQNLHTSNIPLFVTTDTFLHLYHLQFDETLKGIEEREFIPDINNLTNALLNDALQQYEQFEEDLKEAASRNIAYLSVAQKLIDPNASPPALVDDIVTAELAKIQAHSGFETSDIFIYDEDYSQYVPRGHYTRSDALERYFKTMMWYGRMAFLLKGAKNWGPLGEALISIEDARIQTLQAFLLATSLRNVLVDERTGLDIWDRLYTVTAFYVGIADDLTPYDYLWALDQVFGNNFTLSSMAEEDNLLALKTELALLPSPQIYGGTGNIVLSLPVTDESLNEVLDMTKGMRLFGQRFIPDSYMFQHMVFPEVCDYLGNLQSLPFTAGSDGSGGLSRVYMRGLDLMALLGSNEALKILIDEGDTDYRYFWLQFSELKDEFDALSQTDWNRNLYWSWLHTLKPLLCELPEGYPNFMHTQAWHRRQLNSALASWTQLRHDTILYAKQSYTPASRGGGPPLPPSAYIEPLPIFWGRLLSLTQMTLRGLDDLNVLTPEARRRFIELEELLQRMLDIVAKQLMNEPLSSEDRGFSKTLIRNLDSIITGTENIALKTTLVADVHTNPAEGQVVEEATGKVDLIIVACQDTDGLVFLAAGPVLSYYEFKHHMSDRLTDETWRQMLNSPDSTNRPTWYTPLMLQSEKPSYPAGWTRLTNNDADDFSPRWSPDGQKIAFESNHDIYVMNSDGNEQTRLTSNPGYDISPCWSPDGQKIAFASYRDGNHDIYIMNADGSEQNNLTNNPAIDGSPCWSPDGQKIAFDRGGPAPPGQGNHDIYIMNADGSEQNNLTNNPAIYESPCWSPDGQKIAFVSITGNRIMFYDIYVMNADGSEQKRLTNNFSNNWSPSWSPDGQKIAFVSDRDGNSEIYVMNADGAEQRNLTNNPASDAFPCWSPDGKKLAFSSYIYGNLEIFIMNVAE